MSERYRKSEEWLERAERLIPLGSQTFSKSRTQYPRGAAPFFASRAKGSRLWDLDGNEYVDFVNALAAVTLGYGDPDVDAAVRAQLESGTIFTLAHPLELEVAERLRAMVPCAEMARFGKNGSDAAAGAVRLARAYTKRDRVACCGYHGWQDWYIGSTSRGLGVPKAVAGLTHPFAYNDAGSLARVLREHPGEFAAVILEPLGAALPEKDFLREVQELARREGAVLIFDETITGFRVANGGAQELYGVTPDLAAFGKGIANGYPLSALAGRAEIMRLLEEVFFSFTFGGETLSLAAAKAVLDKLRKEPVTASLKATGEGLGTRLRALIAEKGLAETFSVTGHPAWTFLQIKEHPKARAPELKTYLLQETLARGILTLGTHNLSYAHSPSDIDALLSAYGEILGSIRAALDGAGVRALLRCAVIEPLFKIR